MCTVEVRFHPEFSQRRCADKGDSLGLPLASAVFFVGFSDWVRWVFAGLLVLLLGSLGADLRFSRLLSFG